MKAEETKLVDAKLLTFNYHPDERGYFLRTYSGDDYKSLGLVSTLSQVAIAQNKIKGTVRGMHFQVAPFDEAKIVRCIRGSIFDVIIDLRPQSRTFCQWAGFTLTDKGAEGLYVPPGFAHGYQTLEDHSEILYHISQEYSPDHYRGVRWNDPRFGVELPLPVTTIAPRDASYPLFSP